MDLLDLLVNGDPQQQQMLRAQMLRGQMQLNSALQQNRKDASQYDLLNFAATAPGNNPSLAAATGNLQKSAQLRGRVQPLGQSSIIVGDQVLENPEYSENKDADRHQRMLSAAALLESRRAQQEMRREIFSEAERGRNERAADQRALRMTLAAMAQGNRGAGAADKAAAAKDKATEAALQKYSGKLTSEGIPDFEQALADVEDVLRRYPEGKLPGVGRFVGMAPDALMGGEAQDVRSTIQSAMNTLLKARSGAAVTDSEMRRFMQEVARGGGYDEAVFRKAMTRLRGRWDQHTQGLAAGYTNDVHEEYVSRGGRDYRAKPQGKPDMLKDPVVNPAPTNAGSKPKRIKIDLEGNEIK